jgi:hypothetical protein
MLMFMNNKYRPSKKDVGFFLIAVLVIGIIVVITQMANVHALNNVFNCITQKVNKSKNITFADAFECYDNSLKGAQKNASQPYQNPNPNNLTKIRSVSATITNSTNPNVTKPIFGANIANNPNVTKPIFGANKNVSGTIDSSQKNNTEIVNYQVVKTPKTDQVSSKHALKKPHGNDVFAKSAEKSQEDSGTESDSKTKKSQEDSGTEDTLQSSQGDKKLNTNNNFDVNKKTKSISKLHHNHNHNHQSTDPLSEDLNSNNSLKHKTNDFSNPSTPSDSFDLPFTAVVPNNLF